MPATSAHPKGLYLLFATEMWERFSYYGNRALLALFMISALAFDKQFTSALYGQYTGLVFLTPLIGGFIADRYWGNSRSILVGGLLMAAGQFMLFFAGSFYTNLSLALPFFYSGLGLICIGNGFFKPNISIMVGQLYEPNDTRKDAAYTIFYMGINLGSFAAPLICGTLGDTGNPADFRWGFLAAGSGMLMSLLVFQSFKNKYLRSPAGELLGLPPKRLTAIEKAQVDTSLSTVDLQRMAVIGVLSFFVIFFWSAFEQAGVSLTFFARESTDRMIMGFEVPASWFQSLNPVFVLIFAPMMARLWMSLSAKGKEPASPTKMAWGLILLGLGYVVIALGVDGIEDGMKVSMLWLITMYWLHTMGELCLSPIGLSLVNKLAPARLASLLMAVWFLANAAANWFAGILAGFYPETGRPLPTFLGFTISNLHEFFMLFVAMSLTAGGLLLLASKPLQKMMHGVR
ncbi:MULTISPECIES: peptide MFS transporter [Deefgea]|uniref:MFS transporter n=1 Tax=Deefgea chitinilytica TaxID=570276 RepID=A0ABS2CA71_9NEIS|nr:MULTISPECIES: peptide MFS transporter [Deefgea]MBM5570907.1 MFS transporter [Deefgea chitinilytica]MBM9888136.1 peptide MFS transporter [Deefgea sp. CFH1-16]